MGNKVRSVYYVIVTHSKACTLCTLLGFTLQSISADLFAFNNILAKMIQAYVLTENPTK